MRQVILYRALGMEEPHFAHVSLIVDSDRSKLSKRRGATSVAEFREQGYLPGALVNYLALLGWSPADDREVLTRDELIRSFDLDRVSSSPAAFDEDKLDWVNAHHLREEPLPAIIALARPFAEAAGIDTSDTRFAAMIELARARISRLSQIPDELAVFFDDSWRMEDEAREILGGDGALDVVRDVKEAIESMAGDLTAVAFKDALSETGDRLRVKGKQLYAPVRAALTGRAHGPGLGEIAELLGSEAVVERLSRVAESRRG